MTNRVNRRDFVLAPALASAALARSSRAIRGTGTRKLSDGHLMSPSAHRAMPDVAQRATIRGLLSGMTC